MSSFVEFVRKMGHRLCSREVPDKFLFPQSAAGLESAEAKAFKKMVLRGRLAPFYPGFEGSDEAPGLELCPVCYMYYRVMNKTKCCRRRICSECIVQIQASNRSSLSGCSCPFCRKSGIHLEVCGGRTDSEKAEDQLDEQKFTEFRLRQRETEVEDSAATRGVVSGESREHSRVNDRESQPNTPLTRATDHTELARTSTNTHYLDSHNSVINTPRSGEPSSTTVPSGGVFNTPRTVQDEYRQEYAALSQRAMQSALSNVEQHQCSEYLGVSPEDLGLQLDEFNDLLLEQVLISSMIEAREDDNAREEFPDGNQEQPQEEEGETLSLSPSLRSHSLPQRVLSEEFEVEEQNESLEERPRTSVDSIVHRLASSGLFSFSAAQQYSGPSTDDGISQNFNSQQMAEVPVERPIAEREIPPGTHHFTQGQDIDSSTTSSESYGTVWGNLMNSLAGFSERNIHLQMIFVKFDDPEIDRQFTSGGTSSNSQSVFHPDIITAEEILNKNSTPMTNNIAVQNPDGSLDLTSAPVQEEADKDKKTPPNDKTITVHDSYQTAEDVTIVQVMQEADEDQRRAISEADERLKNLFSSSS